jgi:hypothetical protein
LTEIVLELELLLVLALRSSSRKGVFGVGQEISSAFKDIEDELDRFPLRFTNRDQGVVPCKIKINVRISFSV